MLALLSCSVVRRSVLFFSRWITQFLITAGSTQSEQLAPSQTSQAFTKILIVPLLTVDYATTFPYNTK